jgi:hypothetical protein
VSRFTSFLAAVLVAAPLVAQTPTPSERILLPILTPPVNGAFGSIFHTELRIANDSDEAVLLIGLESDRCTPICFPGGLFPYLLDAGAETEPGDVELNGSPGRFVYVAADQVRDLSMNLRVHDITRGAQNFGTEIPIVRESEFRKNRIVLVGVPTDARFRNTLRIYGEMPVDVLITVGDLPAVRTKLVGGISFPGGIGISIPDFSKPAYAAFSSFPTGAGTVRVIIEADPDFVTLLPIETQLWAFVTVTNNETQAISTITPQP